jgi:hypothetical protein
LLYSICSSFEAWILALGIWILEFGIWNLGLGIWDLEFQRSWYLNPNFIKLDPGISNDFWL